MNIKIEPNGEMKLSNDRTTITVHPDGTVAVSTMDPLQLTGASLAKLDKDEACTRSGWVHFLNALGRRYTKE